jgi:hypothetical protein
MSCAAPAQQQPTVPVALMNHKMTMKIASAKSKRKKSHSHGSKKKQAVIDGEIDVQNYCHKKFRKFSYSNFENSEINKLSVFGPLTKRGWADTVVGLLPP